VGVLAAADMVTVDTEGDRDVAVVVDRQMVVAIDVVIPLLVEAGVDTVYAVEEHLSLSHTEVGWVKVISVQWVIRR
jgi:hypothetical protein